MKCYVDSMAMESYWPIKNSRRFTANLVEFESLKLHFIDISVVEPFFYPLLTKLHEAWLNGKPVELTSEEAEQLR